MSTFIYEGSHSFYLGAQATLITTDREIASEWAADHIQINDANAWIVGKFVEANRANKNKQYFDLGELQLARPTIAHAPMNINHSQNAVVGSFVASELVYPTGEGAGEGDLNPYIESLGVLWKYYFPDAYRQVAAAAGNGELFFSMEAVPGGLSTMGGMDDSKIYPYEGRTSPNYPEEMNDRTVPIRLHEPHFVGGALVIPPAKPAWDNADAKQVATYFDKHFKQLEMAYETMQDAAPQLEATQWESLMSTIISKELDELENEISRSFSQGQRTKLATSGAAMPDGSFPIANGGDLKNAIRAIGRAKNPAAAKAHIKKRAAALNMTQMIPVGW